MAATPSNMLPLGTTAPQFKLMDVTSDTFLSLDDIKVSKGLVIMFICNHCPYVIHLHDEIKKLTDEYAKKGISFVAISANDTEKYPQDGPDEMKALFARKEFSFPYLYDETQEVAKAYMAACTPDFYLFDAGLKCFYRGRMDESSPGNGKPVTGEDLRHALENLIVGREMSEAQYPSIGCNIKWKS